jgi:predicted nucleic acid-binding protein
MKIVLDTSVVIALLASDEEREGLIHAIKRYNLVCPESITPEIGNAVSAMFKRGRITLAQGITIVEGFQQLAIQIVPLNLKRATEMSHQYHIYAYDAYVLECAERLNSHLVTLDDRMKEIAQKIGISLIEV